MILRILIVEDEPPILRGIKNKIQKVPNLKTQLYTATNGQEALNFLSHTEVDIVFTDIDMPLMNGIELLKHITKSYPTLRTVILSGYADFAYAQQAVKLGSYDYLLKPLELNGLTKLFYNLAQEIGVEYLYQLVYKDSLRTPSSLELFDTPLYILSLCSGILPIHGNSDKVPIPSFEKIEIDTNNTWKITSKFTNEQILVLHDVTDEEVFYTAKTLYEQLLTKVSQLTITLSAPITSLEDFYTLYKQFPQVVYENMSIGTSQIVILNNRDTTKTYTLSPTREKKFLYALENKQLSLLEHELDDLLDKVTPLKLSPATMATLLEQILNLCYTTHFITTPTSSISDVAYSMVLKSNCYQELFTHFLDYIVTAIKGVSTQKERTYSSAQDKAYLINEIEAFIQQNITTNISSQVLSEQFGLVPPYISKLFKTYKGISPSEYILALRLDKAKDMLLENPNLRSKDIAEILGYTDPLYFSRVFKKSTGVYPSEYRKKGKSPS